MVAATLADMDALSRDLLVERGADDPVPVSRTVPSWLLGAIVPQQPYPATPEALRRQLNSIIGGGATG
ncbi:hypothetical protein [Nocardia sp. alder85J]|uniref:hypothetical protein n=1 Tax=Nocardia sp. alder85J TaxID=2862949 RepID=UPI001CD4A86C|nr:hypothetical protein [Nocardia sp. alder85J]MCX4095005.1 hypothetical protein [Nocardia sp. alder85J]